MFEIGSEAGSWGISGFPCRQTMHWRSAPRWSQPPEFVVHSCIAVSMKYILHSCCDWIKQFK